MALAQTQEQAAAGMSLEASRAANIASGAYASNNRNIANSTIPTPAALAQSPSEPAVLSSTNITDNVIPAAKDKLAALATKGTTVGQDGVVQYADGSAVPAPPNATPDGATYVGDNGQKYAAPAATTDAGGEEEKQITDLINSMKSSLDGTTLGTIQSIHSQFDQLRADQTAANTASEKSRSQSLLLAGTSRYAPAAAASTMLAQTSYGLRKIADLDAQENQLIATARKAQADGQMQLMQETVQLVEKKREEKVAAANDLNKQLQTANQKSSEARYTASRDEAVAGLVAQGTNKAADIVKAMNDAGWTMTAADVSGVLKSLQPSGSTGDIYKFSSADVGKLLGAGINADNIQALSDFYNGRTDTPPSLTAAQSSAVQNVLTKPKASSSSGGKTYTSGGLTYTNDDLGNTSSWLAATKGPDKYVDPNAYQQAFDAWVGDKGLPKDFLAKFPPKQWINPANDWLPQYLKSKSGTAAPAATDVASQINALFGTK